MNYKLQPAGEVTPPPPAPHASDCSSNGLKIDSRGIGKAAEEPFEIGRKRSPHGN